MSLLEVFEKELDYFESDIFIEFIEQALPLFPSYYGTVPSSSSGKHHPPDERGEGGQLLHTKRVMYFCNEMTRALGLMGDLKECFLLAGLLHDSFKFTETNGELHTDPFHPLKPRESFNSLIGIIGVQNYDTVMDLIESHSGIWSPSPRIMPDENEILNWAFHFCDYFASRSEVITNV